VKNEADKIIEKHLPMVYRYAHKYKTTDVTFEDLVSAGLEGLWEAYRNYKDENGTTFGVYAKHWVKKYILMELLILSYPFRIPQEHFQHIGKMFRGEGGYREDYVKYTDIEFDSDAEIPVSAGEDDILNRLEVEKYKRDINNLSYVEKESLLMKFSENNYTVREIANKLGMSHMGVIYAIRRAINKIKAGRLWRNVKTAARK